MAADQACSLRQTFEKRVGLSNCGGRRPPYDNCTGGKPVPPGKASFTARFFSKLETRNFIKMNVAQLIARCLENEGVKYIFGLPGEEIIHLVDALNQTSIRFILVRSEQAGAFMADMYGRVTGQAGVCLATLGPGAINLLLGVADAQTDSAPLVALSAQVGLGRIYKETHQVVDLVAMFKPVTKWSDTLLTPQAAPEMIRHAFNLAQTERPGAVYLAIPQDVAVMEVAPERRPLPVHPAQASAPAPAQIAQAAALLEAAQDPHHPGGPRGGAPPGPGGLDPLFRKAADSGGHHLPR